MYLVKNIARPFFEIFIEILYFNYNSLITRKKYKSSLTTAKGQWLEEQRNDTCLYSVTYLRIRTCEIKKKISM